MPSADSPQFPHSSVFLRCSINVQNVPSWIFQGQFSCAPCLIKTKYITDFQIFFFRFNKRYEKSSQEDIFAQQLSPESEEIAYIFFCTSKVSIKTKWKSTIGEYLFRGLLQWHLFFIYSFNKHLLTIQYVSSTEHI